MATEVRADKTRESATRRGRVWPVAVCVALLGAVGVASVLERAALVAWWHRGHITPDKERDPREAPQEQPTREQLAAADLREQAFAVCDEGGWAACVGKLDAAKAIDSEGDADPRVQGARATAEQGLKRDERYQGREKKKKAPEK